MDSTGNRLYFVKVVLLTALLHVASLCAEWNEEFLNNSLLLAKTIDSFREPRHHYAAHLRDFQNTIEKVNSEYFSYELKYARPHIRKNYFKHEYVFKNRTGQNIHESTFWELSIILSLDDYVTPSYPVKFGDNLIILQPFENFIVGQPHENLPLKRTDIVSLRDYYYAHILAFLLGAWDLSGRNIGITPQNNIRFFDNEEVFVFDLLPRKMQENVFVPFASVAFDWSQYRQPISATLAQELREFILQLYDKKDELQCYVNIRGLSETILLGIYQRLDILNAFEFQEGVAFVDFIQFFYPQLSQGLDEFNALISELLHCKVDHGIALFFATRNISYWTLTSQQKKTLDAWIQRYVP